MLLSHQKKFIYIHIYKVAGTSIREALGKYGEKSYRDFPLIERVKYLLSDRFISFIKYSINHISAFDLKQKLKPAVFDTYFKFTFVRNPWDWHVSLYHYILIKTWHQNHETVKAMKSFNEFIRWRIDHYYELQSDFIYDKQGNCLVDFVGRFENINADYKHICEKIGVPYEPLPIKNTTEHKHYREYYDDESRELIAKAFKKDIDLFGYNF